MESLTKAHAEAEDGMRRALRHAEAEVPNWGELAYTWIIGYAETHDRFTGWMLVKAAALDPNFSEPPTQKAWGSQIKKAARNGVIVRDGTAKDPHRHGNLIQVWRSTVFTP